MDDIAIGAPLALKPGGGVVYVVFGRSLVLPYIPAFNLDTGNTVQLIGSNNEWAGASVSSAGDINGDGVDDLLIGANHASKSNATLHGAAYVVFGKDTTKPGIFFPQTIRLQDLTGTDGFRITSNAAYSELGDSVSSAGDVNGDGMDDILIGAPGVGPEGSMNPTLPGFLYVIFGHKTSSPPMDQPFPMVIDVSLLNGQSVAMLMNGGFANGFRINGAVPGDRLGMSVSRAGKVNIVIPNNKNTCILGR